MRMNNKGQFTIIAALLVTVILIGTVVSTYSAIRYSPTKDQPQVLSSVDEINLALRQLLGFTLGYYGSVLQVTGNTTYAQNITTTYLNSGLVSIANTKPELGVSFNVTSLDLHVEWFGTNSYSSGRLNVTYDLAGLGFYGLKYFPVCKLEVSILPTVSGVSRLVVSQDEDEPLNTLTTKDFGFYRYLDTETWDLTAPNSIQEVTLGGTYSIIVPSGVDPDSYFVQVEDARGIMVVASSYTHFTSTSAWSLTRTITSQDFVDQLSNADSSLDKGTHSSFNNQLAKDNNSDSLTELNIGTNTEQYITLQNSNVDASADKGSHSSFDSQKAKDGSFDLLTEQNTGSGVAIAKVGTDTSGRNTYQQLPLSFSHTLVVGSSRLVVVCVEVEHSGAAVSGVTYGGVAMTLAISRETPATGTKFLSQIWYLLEANLPVIGSKTVSVTQTGSTSGLCSWACAMEYTGVNQGAPEATNGVTQTSGATITNIVSPSSGAYVVSATGCGNAGSFTHGSSQAELFDLSLQSTATYSVAELRGASGQTSLSSTFTGTVNRMVRVCASWRPVSTINYVLDLEEQFTGVDFVEANELLCIYAGNLGSESLRVDVWNGLSWVNVISGLLPNQWNNVSVSTWLSSSTFTIRFNGGTETGDLTLDTWNIDAVLLSLNSNFDPIGPLQDSTITVEWIQNGTLRRMGQNLNLTTNAKPIPPIPVKAIHINQTFVNGTNMEVPFQVEDWASNYSIPLGLTSNATVFSNKQMLVYLLDKSVMETTIWWNGSDLATQTPKAFSNVYFTGDNPSNNRITNGRLVLDFGGGFALTSTGGSATSTTNFMRINSEASVYGASPAYVIHHGVVRDIVQQEAEWNDGANNCPNLYANIVITLPARVTYYTYQLRIMFLNSQQDRTINDLCPIKIAGSFGTLQTEDGSSNGFPIVSTGDGTYYNSGYPTLPGTAHHWSQYISGASGTGIMFTDSNNRQLYAFDSFVGSASGALKATSGTPGSIELLPVTRSAANHYNSALDITWSGAVATFSGTSSPIYSLSGGNPTGLWVLAEYQPTIGIAAGT